MQGEALDGSRRWLPAGSVFYPFSDPERADDLPPASSSGVAAHTDVACARRGALAELAERDAFMWTWIQRISRERLDRRGLDDRTAAIVRDLESRGRRVEFVNLTLDTWPIVLCAVLGRPISASALPVTAAPGRRRPSPRSRAFGPGAVGRPARVTVDPAGTGRWPARPHRRLYGRADTLEAAEFLVASADEIAFEDVGAQDRPLEDLTTGIAEPVFVELSSPATRPFRVVRAAVPGMVPISFGYDREPLGMPRLAAPKVLAGGRRLEESSISRTPAPLTPHPFP